MDAYDHVAQATIRSSALPLDTPTASGAVTPNPQSTDTTETSSSSSTSAAATTLPNPAEATATDAGTLSSDLREAYTSFSSSEWGTRLGGFWGSVRKSGESVISGVRNEASIASEEALRGLGELKREIAEIGSGVVVRSRGLTLTGPTTNPAGEKTTTTAPDEKKEVEAVDDSAALADTDGLVARFRAEAERRLKDIQKAEDAADEALLRFGSNIRSFLRDAVTVSGPEAGQDTTDRQQQLLFESKDADGKRVIHTSRVDAQLHAIHSSLNGFLKDPPASAEYAAWSKDFDVDKHTQDIASNLEKYEELRRAMEKLVPESVDYNTFWTRYYYLRLVVESEEKRRKEMLQRATLHPEEEVVGWDEDSDEEPGTPQPKPKVGIVLHEAEPRKSGDQHSQPDSDASYDLVSGATSHTPSSPKEDKDREMEKTFGERKPTAATTTRETTKEAAKDDSDEEDWE